MADPQPISDERLRNTRAWAAARVGTLSAAEVIVYAIDELFRLREGRRIVTCDYVGCAKEAVGSAGGVQCCADHLPKSEAYVARPSDAPPDAFVCTGCDRWANWSGKSHGWGLCHCGKFRAPETVSEVPK